MEYFNEDNEEADKVLNALDDIFKLFEKYDPWLKCDEPKTDAQREHDEYYWRW